MTHSDVSPTPSAPVEPQAAAAEANPVPGRTAYWQASLAIVAGSLVVDHVVKWLAIEHLMPGNRIVSVVPGLFQLRYAENTGAAFSFLDGRVGFLALVSVVVSAMLAYWWWRVPKEEVQARLAFALVVGGAVGNLIDRAFRGYVVDMFEAYFRQWSWPVFNVADSCICVGMGILILRMWKGKI